MIFHCPVARYSMSFSSANFFTSGANWRYLYRGIVGNRWCSSWYCIPPQTYLDGSIKSTWSYTREEEGGDNWVLRARTYQYIQKKSLDAANISTVLMGVLSSTISPTYSMEHTWMIGSASSIVQQLWKKLTPQAVKCLLSIMATVTLTNIIHKRYIYRLSNSTK